jgi:hypothetical protein
MSALLLYYEVKLSVFTMNASLGDGGGGWVGRVDKSIFELILKFDTICMWGVLCTDRFIPSEDRRVFGPVSLDEYDGKKIVPARNPTNNDPSVVQRVS